MRVKIITGFSFLLLMISVLMHAGFTQTMTNVGTDFWVAFQPNWNNNPPGLQLFISSTYSTTGTVYSAYPGVNQDFTVVPGVVTTVILPTGVGQLGGVENKGIRITSADPISLYGLNRFGASTDAYLALPVNALGNDYRVVAYKQTLGGISQISVVATANNTVVTIFNHWTNSTSTMTLNQGQSYLSTDAQANGQDVTGSRIQSNHPVAVFGSDDCVYIPAKACPACDHIVEEMFPLYAWGRNFVTVPLAGRDKSGDVFRIVAANDGTVIAINGLNVATINAGDYYERNLTGYNSIITSNPAMVAQFAKGEQCSGNTRTGDPLMMLIPPTEQFLTNYTIQNLFGFWSNWVNVVAPDYALGTIYQDGVLIPDTAFTKISNTNYYGAQRSVTWWTHNFTSTYPFGVFVYGWDADDSYGYPGGCAVSPVATVRTITLAPDTSYGQLNVTNVCLTATVKDSLQNPVVGVLVNFHVSGLGLLTGNAYTDSSGNAKYCYTRTGTTPGTDQVYAEVSGITSNTVVVFWSVGPPCVNPSNGGTIGDDQTSCLGFTPSPLVNLVLPSGQYGNLEYKWQLSTTSSSSGFSDIPGTDSAAYSPGVIIQNTWYKRIARVDCKTSWAGARESNVLEMTVTPPLPVGITISVADSIACEGDSVLFTATPTNGGTAPVYQWKVNGSIAGTNSPGFTYIPTNGDKVNCVLTSNAPCISNNPATSNTINMTVEPYLPVSISVSASTNPVCSGSPVTIIATPMNGGTSPYYQWWVNGISEGSNFPDFTYIPSNGDRVICMMTSNYPCRLNPDATDTIIITVNSELKTVDTTLCYGTSYYAGGKWQTVPGVYIDTLPAPVECVRYIETMVNFKSRIPLELGPDTTLCGGDIILDATIPGAAYLWQDGYTGSIYTVDASGEYWVLLTYDNCQASDSVRIGECPKPLMFPNAFTPNGDGLNDTFHPVGKPVPFFSMRIFNRWGAMIFETTSMEPGWDGTYKGERCPVDTYVYVVNYRTIEGETFQIQGYVILSR